MVAKGKKSNSEKMRINITFRYVQNESRTDALPQVGDQSIMFPKVEDATGVMKENGLTIVNKSAKDTKNGTIYFMYTRPALMHFCKKKICTVVKKIK